MTGMIKNPMYRRGARDTKNGAKERIIWMLSNRPMSGRELAEAIGEHYDVVRSRMSDSCLNKNQTASISVTDWFIDRQGNRDRVYTLNGKPKRVAAKVTAEKTLCISKKGMHIHGQEQREIHEKAAARRRRLMDAGLWVSLSDIS